MHFIQENTEYKIAIVMIANSSKLVRTTDGTANANAAIILFITCKLHSWRPLVPVAAAY